MQPPGDRPRDLGQSPLDRHVDVFVVRVEREAILGELALDRVETGQQRVAVLVRDDLRAASILACARDCSMS